MKPYLKMLLPLAFTFLVALGWSSCQRNAETEEPRAGSAESEQPAGVQSEGDRQESMELIPMMRLLLSDIYTVDEGIYTVNFDLVAEGAGNIADHPVMTGNEKELVKSALGEEMSRFVEYDMIVHHHADSMRTAARNENMQEVLRHYNIVQQGCVDCHNDFRDAVRTARQ